MSDRDAIETMRVELARCALQLRTWANESRNGGWSTHQVDPMRRKADEIDEVLSRLEKPLSPHKLQVGGIHDWDQDLQAQDKRPEPMSTSMNARWKRSGERRGYE